MNLGSFFSIGGVFTNLFWFSFLIPGGALIYYLEKRSILYLDSLAKKIIFSFLGTSLLLLPITLIGYLLQLQIYWILACYVVLEVIGIYILFPLHKDFNKKYFNIAFLKTIPGPIYLLIACLVFDYILCTYLGGYFYGDAMIHAGKIYKTAFDHLSISDAFFKGAIETRYHINLFHVIYALPVSIGAKVVTVWKYSFAFSRLLIWLSYFVLICDFIKNKKIAAITTAFLIFALSFTHIYANLPREIIFVFFVTFLISLVNYLETKKVIYFYSVLGSALAISFIHPIYSLMELIFVCLVLGVSFLFRKITVWEGLGFIPVVFSLAWSPIFSAVMPNLMTKQSTNVETGVNTVKHYFGGLFALNFNFFNLTMYLVIASVFVIFLKLKTIEKKLIFACSVLFPLLTIFNPLVFPILNKYLPVWALLRFDFANTFLNILIPLGLVLIFAIISEKYFVVKYFYLFAGIIMVASGVYIFSSDWNQIEKVKSMTEGKYIQEQTLQSLSSQIPRGSIIAANNEISMGIPAVMDDYVVAIYEENATPDVDMNKQKQLRDDIFSNDIGKQEAALRESGAKYVIYLDEDSKYFKKPLFDIIIGSNNYLLLAKVDNKFLDAK